MIYLFTKKQFSHRLTYLWQSGFVVMRLFICLGAWWAYQEDTWGGWWNNDVSEFLGLWFAYVWLITIHQWGGRHVDTLWYVLGIFWQTFFHLQYMFSQNAHNFGLRFFLPPSSTLFYRECQWGSYGFLLYLYRLLPSRDTGDDGRQRNIVTLYYRYLFPIILWLIMMQWKTITVLVIIVNVATIFFQTPPPRLFEIICNWMMRSPSGLHYWGVYGIFYTFLEHEILFHYSDEIFETLTLALIQGSVAYQDLGNRLFFWGMLLCLY